MARRFSLDQFITYEPLIEAAVAVLPARYTISCPWNGYAQATVSRNLREAIQALHAHPEWVTSVNRAAFNKYFSTLEVGEEPGLVIVRLRTRGQRAAPDQSVSCANVLHFTKRPDPAVLVELAQLVNFGLLSGLKLINSDTCVETMHTLCTTNSLHNVAVVADGTDIVLL